ADRAMESGGAARDRADALSPHGPLVAGAGRGKTPTYSGPQAGADGAPGGGVVAVGEEILVGGGSGAVADRFSGGASGAGGALPAQRAGATEGGPADRDVPGARGRRPVPVRPHFVAGVFSRRVFTARASGGASGGVGSTDA